MTDNPEQNSEKPEWRFRRLLSEPESDEAALPDLPEDLRRLQEAAKKKAEPPAEPEAGEAPPDALTGTPPGEGLIAVPDYTAPFAGHPAPPDSPEQEPASGHVPPFDPESMTTFPVTFGDETLTSPPKPQTEPPAQPDPGSPLVAHPLEADQQPEPLDHPSQIPNQQLSDTAPRRLARRAPDTPPGATPPPPPSGLTRDNIRPAPALGTQGLPLPRRVDEIDMDATRVSPSALPSAPTRGARLRQQRTGQTASPGAATGSVPAGGARRAYSSPPQGQPAEGASYGVGVPPPRYRYPRGGQPAPPPAGRGAARSTWGCLVRGALISLFALVLILLCGGSLLIVQYYRIARSLPDVTELRQKASQFETTRILDRNGNLLYEILDPNAGRRTFRPLSKISPYLVAATIATEDKGFYSHPGFDVSAIFRAFLQNYQSGETVSGASTITQQLARNLLFTPEERSSRTYERKIREAILASELTRRYTKDEILELYLNESNYGNLAYGVEAAAETYFGTTADKLTLGQAAFLAGLPQAPALYDVYTNRELTLQRQRDVLVLMYELSQEQGCIYVSNSPQPVCVDVVAAANAANELKNYTFHSPDVQMRYPHWVNFVIQQLQTLYDPQTIYRSGFSVYTTLDPGLQEMAEGIVKAQVEKLADNHASDGALVAIRPSTGEILAMVGSADFNNAAISGEVNMAVAPRQPGSSIKPLTYTAAFEKGWTPATLIWDVPSEFSPSGKPDPFSEPYRPVNYDGKFHGPVTVRTALANSFNVPAVKTLQFVGIYDDPQTPQPDGFINMARRLGITTLTREDYGLSLTLGGGDVSLLELTGAYAVFANGGRRVPPVAITKILDLNGAEVYTYTPPAGDQVVRPEHAYLITSILSDNEARSPMFGRNSVLRLPFPVAAKTGTTNDFRDNWTLGYTPDLTVGVWVGNADYTPMRNTTGLTGAAPIWSQFMQDAIQTLTGGNPAPFSRPAGIVERVICSVSGTEPSEWCPDQRNEIFAADQPPLPKEDDLWQKLLVDTWTGLKASPACKDFTDERFVLNVSDPFAIQWIKKDPAGRAWAQGIGFERPVTFAPSRECKADDPRPTLVFNDPREGDVLRDNPIDIYAQVNASANFESFRLEYGVGGDPVEWKTLLERDNPVPQPDKLFTWDVLNGEEGPIPAGPVTLRLTMQSTEDTYAELKLHIILQVPTPTPTASPTPTPTPTLTPTPPPSSTPPPSNTPLPSDTPPATAVPSETPHLPKPSETPPDTGG
jgi:penicillin-binding protein 1C